MLEICGPIGTMRGCTGLMDDNLIKTNKIINILCQNYTTLNILYLFCNKYFCVKKYSLKN
jgi:hypothetical protein